MTMRPTHEASSSMALDVRKVAGNIGAELVGLDLAASLDDATVAAIRNALLLHKVVFFRGQQLTPVSHVAFARRFGLVTAANQILPGLENHPHVFELDYGYGGKAIPANVWHTDMTFLHRPPLGVVLRAVTVPPWGGDTLWANTAYAYTQLSAELRTLADTLWTVHTNTLDQSRAAAVQQNEKLARFQQVFTSIKYETSHPMVQVHPETRERTLLLSSFAKKSAQLSATALADLHLQLQSHITVPENTVRWRWAPGDVAFWDNRATQHYALYDYGDQPRRMQRVTIAGDVPISVDGRRSVALSGDDHVFNADDVHLPAE